ncbi:MAG: extracellular solute-binding protein, partial [Verrucomicrobia bacterium]|nr:extracellular solute-binding protein [Verrucomicrobiota bacterium]
MSGTARVAVSGIALLSAFVLLGLFGSGWKGKPHSGVQELRWWNMFAGPDGGRTLGLVKKFNAANPDVRVSMQRMDAGLYYNKLFVAGLARRGPEIFVVHADVLPRFARANLLEDLGVLRDRDGWASGDFDSQVVNAVTFDGRMRAIPWDIHPVGLYYNAELFRRAGVVDETGRPQPPTNREEFLEAIRKINQLGEKGFAFTWLRTNLYTIMRQFGGRLFSEDGRRCTLDDPHNIEALQFCVDLIHRDHLVAGPQGGDPFAGFRQGHIGMVMEGIWMIADFGRAGLDLGVAPAPLLGTVPAVWMNSHCLALRPGLSPETREAAWRFIRFLSDEGLDWAGAGQIPARISLRRTSVFE